MDAPRSLLLDLFEAAAAAMELDRGQHRLELLFDEGHLRSWFAHAEKRRPGELAAFDQLAGDLLERTRVRSGA